MLEAYFLDLGWLLFALFFGVAMGSLTGLIPGFHVNNVALILLALSPVFLSWGIPLSAVAAIIVSTGTVHTFLNYMLKTTYQDFKSLERGSLTISEAEHFNVI